MKKLKKFIVLLLSGFILIIVFQFCESLHFDDTQEKEFINPFEIVGEIHNEGLSYVLKSIDKMKKGDVGIQDICDLSTTFMLSNKKANFKIENVQKLKELESIVLSELKSKHKSIDTMTIFLQGKAANKYYLKLNAIYENVNFNDTLSSFKAIKRWENEVWTSRISEREKSELLIMSSVGRHSFSFWVRNLPEYSNIELTKSEEWRTVAIVLLQADMVGGLLGFIGGAIVGGIGGTLIMPGVGSLTGAILEGVQAAVWGAIINSAYTFFMDYVLPFIVKSNFDQVLQIEKLANLDFSNMNSYNLIGIRYFWFTS